MRTRLPIYEKLLIPEPLCNVREKLCNVQSKVKLYYDKSSRQSSDLYSNQNVVIKSGKVWEPAIVIKKSEYLRSYYVKNKLGNLVRKNSYHIRKSNRPI